MDTLNGVDVSGWDEGVDLRALTADFVIVKATEGVHGTAYNPTYRQMADAVLSSGKLLGFYHYANGGDATAEADCFYEAIKDYRGKALAALDWEGQGNKIFGGNGNAAWCKRFLDRIRERFGGTPIIYTSKGVCNERDWSSVADDYPLWGAQYAYDDHTYQGYQSDPWQSEEPWGAWGTMPLMFQYGYVNPRPNNGGKAKLDGEVFYGSREDWQRMCGTQDGGRDVMKVSIADVAARIHYDMVTDPRNGYSQRPGRWGGDYGGTKTLTIYGRNYTYKLGSYDCSSSVIIAWRLALQGTPYEGRLDGATYTSDMQEAFVSSGLFTASLTSAKRGDLYLTAGDHTAMCQDGGSDGVFGYDCLSEFNMNENGGASNGRPGDQTGYESVFRDYYNRPWRTVLHYNGKADYYVSTGGVMKVTPHCQTYGWRDTVTETDVVGTTGQSKALEGLRFELPEGVEFELWVHIQHGGDIYYHRVAKGLERFVYGSANASIRMEAIKFHVTVNTNPATKGKTLQYRAHIQGKGWLPWVSDGEWAGTRGEAKRLEAFQCRWT